MTIENRQTAKKSSKKKEKRTFAVFMDYSNLEKNIPLDKYRNFSWLLDPILEIGKIIFAFVFVPENLMGRAPIYQLSNIHGFHIEVCPRQMSGVVSKDADTVDAKLCELARALIDYTEVTDVVIISGDADFGPLVNHAIFQQKKVTVVSADKAMSGRYLEMQIAGLIEVQQLLTQP